MVNHWLNWNADSNNVIASNCKSFCVGSGAIANLFEIDQQLSAGKPIAQIVNPRTLTLVPFGAISMLSYQQREPSVSIEYATKKSSHFINVEFGSAEKAEEFFDHTSQYLQQRLVKVTGDKSRYFGRTVALCSLIFSAVFLYAFFYKFRLLSYAVPLGVVSATAAYIVHRERKQQRICRWVSEKLIRHRYIDLGRAFAACAIFSTLALVVAPHFVDRHGAQALFVAAKGNQIKSGDVQNFLNRNALLNYVDTDGTSALWWSIKHNNDLLSLALVRQGADMSGYSGKLLEHAISNNAGQAVLREMMRRGALEVAEVMGGFDTKYYLKTDTGSFASEYSRYRLSL